MNISWSLLHNLEKEHGDSFYLLDLGAFKANYHEFLESFQGIYPKARIAYSYKTNYMPRLCQLVNLWGGYAEVVSRMEYDLAVRVGVPPQRIIFNGPHKTKCHIERSLLAGSIVNLDAQYEVAIVKAIAQRCPERTFSVGIRCNFDIGIENVSRFGFDVERKEFEAVFETLAGLENCRIDGLHCHFGTSQRTAESYALRARKMLDLAVTYFPERPPRFIDLGGGFMSKMSPELREQFPFSVPSYQEYAQAIAPQFVDAFPDGSGPELILEPGVAITADISQFVAKVIDVKTVRSRTVALVSGSVFDIKPTRHKKNLPIRVLSDNSRPNANTISDTLDIVGYTCMEDDCLYSEYTGSIAAGDYVVFENVGAYTNVLRPPFIRPCPPILGWRAQRGAFEILKRRETMTDVFATYDF